MTNPALLRSPLIVLSLMLAGSMPVDAAWRIVGQPSPGRVGDGSEFTTISDINSSISTNFKVDSSLTNTQWWASGSRGQPWNAVVSSPTQSDFFAMRVDDPIPAGGSFYFGISYRHEMRGLRNDFRVLGGADGTSQLPGGTRIYVGYALRGQPAGVTHAQHSIPSGGSSFTTNVTFINNNAPPSSAFPAAFAPSYSWLQYERPTTAAGTSVIAIDLNRTPARSATEVVYVIVLPTGQSYTPPTNAANRLHFSWTVDPKGTPPLGPVNPLYGNILTPEPSRTLLLGVSLFMLLLRRVRPRR